MIYLRSSKFHAQKSIEQGGGLPHAEIVKYKLEDTYTIDLPAGFKLNEVVLAHELAHLKLSHCEANIKSIQREFEAWYLAFKWLPKTKDNQLLALRCFNTYLHTYDEHEFWLNQWQHYIGLPKPMGRIGRLIQWLWSL